VNATTAADAADQDSGGAVRTAPPLSVVVLGPPGAGKSSVCAAIRFRYANARSFAVRLRYEKLLREGHPLGLRIRDAVGVGGGYIPIDLIGELFDSFLAARDPADLVLLEGFPINRAQVELAHERLAAHGRRLDRVLDLRIREEVALQRTAARRVCPRCELDAVAGQPVPEGSTTCPRCGTEVVPRKDDRGETVRRRLRDFAAERAAILEVVPSRVVVRLEVSDLDRAAAVDHALAELGLT
jgi:adenylate kinase